MKIQLNKKFTKPVLALILALVSASACDPVPRRQLTEKEKIDDLSWVRSKFYAYYAPLSYKEQLYKFTLDQTFEKYKALVAQTKNNDEFYALLLSFVSTFKDAHTSGTLTAASLPGRVKVAYLGFNGKRVGDTLVVTEILPTIDTGKTKYPISVGDKITQLDGVALKDIVMNEMVQSRDLGQPESNLTFHMNRIFNRMSTAVALPAKADAELTFKRNDKEKKVVLPWVVKDVVNFRAEQKAAAKKPVESMALASDDTLQIGFLGFNDQLISPTKIAEKLDRNSKGYRFWDSFVFLDSVAGWTVNFKTDKDGNLIVGDESGEAELRKERNVPGNAVFLPEAKTYPVYVTREKTYDKDRKTAVGSKLVATMRLDSFSPAGEADDVVTEVKKTLKSLKMLGVNDLVIDMINNGGGSLELGMLLAQAFSNKKVVMSEMEFGLNEHWLDDTEKSSRSAPSDIEREIYRRVYEEMNQAQLAGKRLSRRYSAEELIPYALQPNSDLESDLKIVVLVNEMCASMCDIFTAIMKDNKLATVVGSKTMGAGGNVVNHTQAPNSNFDVRQTESLVLRRDGSYIENNGIEPDVAVSVNEATLSKFDSVREKALEILTTEGN